MPEKALGLLSFCEHLTLHHTATVSILDTMHRWMSLVAAVLFLAAPATSQALEVPADTAALGYDAVAAAHWGGVPCGGQVDIRWEHRGPGLNARAEWLGILGQPETYTACSITFNLDIDWDAAKLCTIDVHERGHLMGHDHDDSVLMGPYYTDPIPECVNPQAASTAAPRKGNTLAPPLTVRRRSPKHMRWATARLQRRMSY